MSASLVGSEMCIRDRSRRKLVLHAWHCTPHVSNKNVQEVPTRPCTFQHPGGKNGKRQPKGTNARGSAVKGAPS
eukprot:7523959-Alexandrium_andersonii.AAC.1